MPTAQPTQAPPPAAAPPAPEERLHALDSLRAVAMFLGIVLHGAISFAEVIPVPWPVWDIGRHWSFDLLIGAIHGFRMQLFFLLAGFFACLLFQRLGANAFAKQRLKRIGLPFVLGWFAIMPVLMLTWTWGLSRMSAAEQEELFKDASPGGIPTAHLWFLEYLIIFYTLSLALIWMGDRCSSARNAFNRALEWILHSPLRSVILAALCIWPLWNGPFLGEPEEPGVRLTPRFGAIIYYGLFFAVGWAMHRRRELLTKTQQGIWPAATISVVGYAIYGWIITLNGDAKQPADPWVRLGGSFLAPYYAWAMSFAFIGLFLRFASTPTRWGRYLADSSYWCYLAHLPLVTAIQIVIAPWPAPALLKFGGMLLLTTALLLLAYEHLVRYTLIGRILNGPRQKPTRE